MVDEFGHSAAARGSHRFVEVARRKRTSWSPIEFFAAKSASPLVVTSRAVLDALVLAALDPSVRAIDAVPIAGGNDQSSAIVIDRRHERHVLDVAVSRRDDDADGEGLRRFAREALGLPVLVVTAADLQREPRASNAAEVWKCRAARIPVGDRIAVLEALTEGPLTLAEVAAAARLSRDPVATVLRLACDDLVEIDIEDAPLGPETPVRRRQRPEC